MSYPPTGPGEPSQGAIYGSPTPGPAYPGSPVQPSHPGAPMSGPPFEQQTSVFPGTGAPYGTAPSDSGKGRTILVLAVVAGLLFVLSGVMTGLYVSKNGELNRTERQLTAKVQERDATIEARGKELEQLKTDLQAANDKLDALQQDLTGTKNDRDEQARQKQIIAKCLDQLTTALHAAAVGNRAAYNNAIKGLDKVCDEAEKYL